MANFLRRAGAQILALFTSGSAPGANSSFVQLFAQAVAGVNQLFVEDSDGLIYQLTPAISVCRAMAYYPQDFCANANVQTTLAGGGAANFVQAQQGHPGLLRQTVSATATPDASFGEPATSIFNILLGSGEVVFEANARTVTVQDGTNQWVDRFGMGDTVSGDQANGVYFESDRATNGDNNYRICCANAGTRTKTNTSSAPTANTFQRWRFVVNTGATSVQAYANDTAAGSAVTTNIPTAALAAWFGQLTKTLGSTGRQRDLDYTETYQVVSR